MLKNCNYCKNHIILKPFKVDKKEYTKSAFFVYDKLKNIYCSLLCKINGGN
jgi:hypothetical protein